ncbi:hypothetical protein [Streptomyces sp. NPDC007856]|uniref:hypothetical protein n=1 Tax=Streptomyces sp. NPDC007856 TaxID=3364781 RepID=UPI0036B1C623
MPETKPTVLVLTALALEYAAVRAHIEGRRDRPHPGNGTFVEVGHLPGTPWQVAAAELGEGAKNTAALTASLIGWLRPEAWHGSHALLSAARAAVRDLPDVRAHFKPIATADVVLADAESEMEG